MTYLTVDDMSAHYQDIVGLITTKGREVSPRGLPTLELDDVTLEFTDPARTMPVRTGRALNPTLFSAELTQWLAGVSDLAQLDDVSQSSDLFSPFSDDGIRLYGAYGPRAWRGLARAVRVLAADPESRQAVVSLWRPHEADLTKDLPCTVSWAFRVRGGRLDMITTMRSNDVWLGLVYDAPAMARIQSAVAWALSVPVGKYVHTAHSLHIYRRNVKDISRLRPTHTTAMDHPPMFDDIETDETDPAARWMIVRDMAQRANRGEMSLPESFTWYANRLDGLAQFPELCLRCRYYLPQADPPGTCVPA